MKIGNVLFYYIENGDSVDHLGRMRSILRVCRRHTLIVRCRATIVERRVCKVPKDPVMLLSYVNLKLRDFYSSLDQLCEDLDADRDELIEKLQSIDYHYDEEKNQFV